MDAREEMKRWIASVMGNANATDSKQIKQDIDLFMGAAMTLTTELVNRNIALAKNSRPRKAKPPKSSPQKGPQQPKRPPSSTDTPRTENDAEDRSPTKSRIMKGVKQADPSLADQQRALRGTIYGAQNPDVAFNKAAKAIAR
jgi:hypothetical protein